MKTYLLLLIFILIFLIMDLPLPLLLVGLVLYGLYRILRREEEKKERALEADITCKQWKKQ